MSSHPPAPRSMLLEEFTPLVGETFEVDCTPRTARLVLVEAVPLKTGATMARPPFSLLFSSDPATLLVAGGYAMQARGFGPELIYLTPIIVPIGETGYRYEAVFN